MELSQKDYEEMSVKYAETDREMKKLINEVNLNFYIFSKNKLGYARNRFDI